MYDNDFKSNQYHYGGDNLPHDDYRAPTSSGSSYSYQEPWEGKQKKKKKNGGAGKVIALLLAVLVLATAGGFLGAFLGRGIRHGTAELQQSGRENIKVTVKTVDGHTLMTPAEVYAANVNSVVSINSTSKTTNVFGQTVPAASSGTGFIVTADGYIVTNQHVVSGATEVQVTLYGGETYPATVIGGDSEYDVAVIKIDAKDLTPVILGNSTEVNVGDTILAVGNPLGELTFSQSQGTVSCCNRAINVDGTPFNMIQIDASINPGNSGGPLFNLYGEVVGIVSAKYSSYSNTSVEGLGFAIPISDVQAIITDIMENGAVTNKAYMGITPGTLTEEMAAQYHFGITKGVFVYSVEDGSAADKAGLRRADVITAMDGKEIGSYEDLVSVKKSYKAGDTVTLTVYRDDAEITVDLTFDVQPENTEEDVPVQSTPDQGNDYFGQMPQMPDNYGDLFRWFFGNQW